jgi:YesN/AraC family two-component response regulator
MNEKIKVLIVDDNRIYRDAFRRNLSLRNYTVCEAENADEAIECLKNESPDVIVTDLRMRTRTEGLDLIKQTKAIDPLLPIVMISAVGTFEEGAQASKLGAVDVISKSGIDKEVERLYRSINRAHEEHRRNSEHLVTVEQAKTVTQEDERRRMIEQLQRIMSDSKIHPLVRSEAFDAMVSLNERALRSDSQEVLSRAVAEPDTQKAFGEIEADLRTVLADYEKLDPESRDSLRSAEFFYRQQKLGTLAVDVSRNIGFSYCFAVENEAKTRLKKKITRFLSSPDTYQLIRSMLDPKTKQLDLFAHQYILRLQQVRNFDFTVDNVRQTFHRILEHETRYKPDGLKALGIMIVCFGRSYSYRKMNADIVVANPLGLKGLDGDDEVLQFAQLMVGLQHYRNPYIHPEINEMEKVSKLRETAFECLRYIWRIV